MLLVEIVEMGIGYLKGYAHLLRLKSFRVMCGCPLIQGNIAGDTKSVAIMCN
jgi:hypothetical protein